MIGALGLIDPLMSGVCREFDRFLTSIRLAADPALLASGVK
jgi:hypothetical protein